MDAYVDGRVFEDSDAVHVDGRLGSPADLESVLQVPSVAFPVVLQARVVVTLVQVFEDGAEDFGFLVWQLDTPVCRLEELRAAGLVEEGRIGQDVLVGGEETLVAADGDGDDGRSQGSVLVVSMLISKQKQGLVAHGLV